MTDSDALLVRTERDGAVAVITLNRPQKRNALDLAMRAAIAEAVTACARDETIRVLIVTGSETVFAAGADLSLLIDKGAQQVADLKLAQYWEPLMRCPKPVIAAINGFALGAGCELAMMCDILVVDQTARLGQPEARVGIMPGAGGTQRLVRNIGRPMASLMLMTGEPLTGERAWQLGLASDFVEAGKSLERAREWAVRIAAMPPKAMLAIKRVLNEAADLPLDAALSLENREFLLLFDTQDKTEGMRAFLEKRAANFIGR
jgi:enoyl-CoA hydratase